MSAPKMGSILANYPLHVKQRDLVHVPKGRVVLDTKVIFVGNAEVGKTRMMRELLGAVDMVRGPHGMVPRRHLGYAPTIGVEVHPYRPANNVNAIYNIWDVAGNPRFAGMRDGYYVGGNMVVVVRDPPGRVPRPDDRNPQQWVREVLAICPGVPVHYVSNINEMRAILI